MTAIILSYHTHAKGSKHGWWADAIHPAHLGDDGKLRKDTEFTVPIQGARTLNAAVTELQSALWGYICTHPEYEVLHRVA